MWSWSRSRHRYRQEPCPRWSLLLHKESARVSPPTHNPTPNCSLIPLASKQLVAHSHSPLSHSATTNHLSPARLQLEYLALLPYRATTSALSSPLLQRNSTPDLALTTALQVESRSTPHPPLGHYVHIRPEDPLPSPPIPTPRQLLPRSHHCATGRVTVPSAWRRCSCRALGPIRSRPPPVHENGRRGELVRKRRANERIGFIRVALHKSGRRRGLVVEKRSRATRLKSRLHIKGDDIGGLVGADRLYSRAFTR